MLDYIPRNHIIRWKNYCNTNQMEMSLKYLVRLVTENFCLLLNTEDEKGKFTKYYEKKDFGYKEARCTCTEQSARLTSTIE